MATKANGTWRLIRRRVQHYPSCPKTRNSNSRSASSGRFGLPSRICPDSRANKGACANFHLHTVGGRVRTHLFARPRSGYAPFTRAAGCQGHEHYFERCNLMRRLPVRSLSVISPTLDFAGGRCTAVPTNAKAAPTAVHSEESGENHMIGRCLRSAPCQPSTPSYRDGFLTRSLGLVGRDRLRGCSTDPLSQCPCRCLRIEERDEGASSAMGLLLARSQTQTLSC